ncbi:1-deoxy-D-xylulose-5-phosphate reductoisomerase [Pedobacter sp. LMG 31464]|uniref:1-deoxy-D-xylulose 5-phosphate reductoisomerase n=1 Tax=Pedobacter planticolens TaxID=2679964 RepID=A0A923IT41_9SPHI|nr:1-deoxy-D-xylulose-5-phosphate reductoisomerase [Pedobacter planticolens]MBB2144285.1 1-deoxy-D-xylulose-5-phosphate reductoisomerase [Pedobacter planticolens]
MKNISILGSTGSIGTQALEVVRANPDLYKVNALTAQNNAELLIQQALEFKPELVVITCESHYQILKNALPNTMVLCGEDALIAAVQLPKTQFVLTAIMGAVGLRPTIAAIEAKKDIGLANKETLVVAGELVMQLAKENGVKIIPVDSEHSAIFQCLVGEENNPIEKIFLTASGGPFRGKDLVFLANVTKKEALKHPNWIMGAKITIDSASLMNKGLEAIEAKWLFGLTAEQIEVVVHPQSIIHSMVQFTDGSIKAQMGLPDMKLPIHYALAYPQRVASNFERFNFLNYPELTFSEADTKSFRNLELAFVAMKKGGNMPCIINAANEIVVDAFLKDHIGFLQMSVVIEECMQKMDFIAQPTLNNYLETDKQTRIFASQLVTKQSLTNLKSKTY